MNSLDIPAEEAAFLATLNQEKVLYLLIGGYAMKHYGCDRSTEDVDLLIDNSVENAQRLYPVILKALGYKPKFTVDELTQPKKQLTMPNNRIDLLTSIEGLTFGQAFDAREPKLDLGLIIPIISKQHLIYIKELAAKDESRRSEELKDVEWLKSV